MKKLLISLIVAMGLIGCVRPGGMDQGTPPPQAAQNPENVPQAVVPSPGPLAENPTETIRKSRYEILAEKPPKLVLGAKYFYRRTNGITGDYQFSVSKIKSRVSWMGTPAYIVELSKQEGTGYVVTGYLVLDTNLNTLSTLDKDGKLLQAIKGIASATAQQGNPVENPCIKIFDWPLTLGKSFSVEYEIFNNNDKKSYKLTDQVSVANELELVKTSLGEWTTYRIKRISSGAIETHYYAPEIGIDIKQEISQTLDNGEGPGAFIVDLIGYNIPGVGQVGQVP